MKKLGRLLTSRRSLVALGLLSLALIVALSAGRDPAPGAQTAIPDLGFVLVILIFGAALLGLIFLIVVRPGGDEERSPPESRSIRAAFVLAVFVTVASIWFGPENGAEEVPPEEQESVVDDETDDLGDATEIAPLDVNETDVVALIAIVAIVLIVIATRWFNRLRAPPEPYMPAMDFDEQLSPAVARAHQHLSDVADPRTAVLLAYAELEDTAANHGMTRRSSDTPTEHMRAVVAQYPELTHPVVSLSRLYEVARFSTDSISEEQRVEARDSLGTALAGLSQHVGINE